MLAVATVVLAWHTLTLARATQSLSQIEARRDKLEQRRVAYNRASRIVDILHALNHHGAEEVIVAEIKHMRVAPEARSVRDLLAHLEADQASTKILREHAASVLYYIDEALKGTPLIEGRESSLRSSWELFHKEIAPLLPVFEEKQTNAYRELRLSPTQLELAEPEADKP